MIWWNEYKHICFYIILHEPEFSIVTILMDPLAVVFLLGLLNLNFSSFFFGIPQIEEISPTDI